MRADWKRNSRRSAQSEKFAEPPQILESERAAGRATARNRSSALDARRSDRAALNRRRHLHSLDVGRSVERRSAIFSLPNVKRRNSGPCRRHKPREIKTGSVIGAGTMGGGISMNFANAGIPSRCLNH